MTNQKQIFSLPPSNNLQKVLKAVQALKPQNIDKPRQLPDKICWTIRCPLPEHVDKTASCSMTLWKNSGVISFRCWRCSVNDTNDDNILRVLYYTAGLTPADLGRKNKLENYSLIQKTNLPVSPKPVEPKKPIQGCTLLQLSEYTKLPVEYLVKEFGLSDYLFPIFAEHRTIPAVQIPYYDIDNKLVGYRYRVSVDSKPKYLYEKNFKTILYGLWKLKYLPVGTKVIIAEGETDTMAGWFNNRPVIGCPGVAHWKSEWSKYFRNFKTFVWVEPGKAGKDFADKICSDMSAIKIYGTEEIKDILCLHKNHYQN